MTFARLVIPFMVPRRDEALRRIDERMRQTRKPGSLGVMARKIAHDFNNLFTVSLGHAELDLAAVPSESPVHLQLQRILGCTRRAAEIGLALCWVDPALVGRFRPETLPSCRRSVLSSQPSPVRS